MSEAKDKYLASLKTWEEELITNQSNMQYLAKRSIKILKTEIEFLWPGFLKQREKDNGS